MTDQELFTVLDLESPALADVRAAVGTGDLGAAKAALGTHIRTRETPRWLIDWKDRPEPTKSVDDFPKALAYERHEFTFGFTGSRDYTAQFGDTIDWAANPTEGEDKTHLWNESLNRHFHFNELSTAYWETGDERFVRAMVRDWLDWIASNPRNEDESGNSVEWPYGCYAWQTLTTGIRLEASWPNSLYKCLDSAEITDELLAAMIGSVCDQGRHLIKWPTAHNWLTEECMGLYTAGMLFPELKEAAEFRQIAIERLYKQLTNEVYPDGAEYELSGGYGLWVVRNFVHLLERAQLNGLESELPDDLVERMEKMFDFVLATASPALQMVGMNDSGNSDITGVLEIGHELFPNRDDYLFVASRRERGTPPTLTSRGMPWSGHYAMRSGWDADALFALVDSGPWGSAHQHEDKLHLVINAYGKQLLLDPGNYSYDASRNRQYILTTPGHNTVMVDGMGQRRRGQTDTYFWPRPWQGAAPAGNDTLWRSTGAFDVLRGTYRDGYGERDDPRARGTSQTEKDSYAFFDTVTHTRYVIFLKPDYWIIADALVATDDADHRYESLFHFDAEEAGIDAGTKAVVTQNEESPNLCVFPLPSEGLTVDIVKGQTDPVQGWSNGPWRPVPTAIYALGGAGTTWLAYAVCPTRAGESSPITAVESIPTPSDDTCALTVRFQDGRADHACIVLDPDGQAAFGPFTSDAEIACIRCDARGDVVSAFASNGTITKDGRKIET